MIADHLPVLQVVIPLIAAPLCVLVQRGAIAWILACLVAFACFAISLLLLLQVGDGGVISYHLGGWAPPYGIEYRIDALGAFVLVIVSGIAAVVLPYSWPTLSLQIQPSRRALFYAVFLLALTGLLGIVATGDAFNIYVFLEISSLASYVLVAQHRDRRALRAAFQYLVLGTIGATLILIGIGLLYMMTGTLNIMDLSERLPEHYESRTVQMAFAFLTVGICLKLALFPLHLWLPDAYSFAPSSVAAFLSATATKVGAYLLLRFVFTVFGWEFSFEVLPLDLILMPLALIAVVAGSLVAIFQTNVKRLLAYSSVAQIGYIVVGIAYANQTGLTGSVVHLFNHALMKGGLLGANVQLTDLHGLGRRMPFTMAGVVIAGLSLIGLPLTVGFVSKWYLVKAAFEAGLWPVAAVVLASSLLAVAYVGRIVEAAYFHPSTARTANVSDPPALLLVPSWLLVVACVYFGIHTDATIGVAQGIAQSLIGGAR
jgi:multicomponent Na+:H+ antiporter subunit D